MRYGQITTSRLSRVAKKLNADGEWHPSETNPHAWYRVWRKRLVQRATFEDEREKALLLPALYTLEPVELASTGGFREELTIRITDDRLEVALPLGYRESVSDALLHSFKAHGITFTEEDGLLVAHLPFESLTTEDLTNVQERMVEVREAFQQTTRRV